MGLSPGDRVDRYEVIRLLGRGGMGEVYSARDPKLARLVALKILGVATGPGTDGAARLLREARAAAALSHANVLAIFDVGEVQEPESLRGLAYIAMELVDGSSLRAYVGDASIPMQRRVAWLRDVALALGAAHRAGVVHRDVKPENVMIRSDGAVKVLDFGIARRDARSFDAWASTEGQSLPAPGAPSTGTSASTEAGRIVGTPLYMAPEQLRGEEIDGRADQFAWGVMAYVLLTGQLPWGATSEPIAVLSQILSYDPPPPRDVAPGVSVAVSDVVVRALSKRRESRFASMDALVGAFDEERTPAQSFDGGEPLTSPAAQTLAGPRLEMSPATAGRASSVAKRSRRRLALLLGTAAVGLLGAAGLLLARARPESSPVSSPGAQARHESAPSYSRRLIAGFPSNPDFAISPDGRTAAFGRADGVFSQGLPDGTPARVPGHGEGTSAGISFLSNDVIAYALLRRDGSGVEIWSADLRRREAHVVYRAPFDAQGVQVCPDGKRVAFSTHAGLLTATLDGSPPRLIVPTPDDTAVYAVMSPTCDSLVYVLIKPISLPQDLVWISFDGSRSAALAHDLFELNGTAGIGFRGPDEVLSLRYGQDATELVQLSVEARTGGAAAARVLTSWPKSRQGISFLSVAASGAILYAVYPNQCEIVLQTMPEGDAGGALATRRIVGARGPSRPAGWVDANHFVVVNEDGDEARVGIVSLDGASTPGPAVRREPLARLGAVGIAPDGDVLFAPAGDAGACAIERYDANGKTTLLPPTAGAACGMPILCGRAGCLAREDRVDGLSIFRDWDPARASLGRTVVQTRGKELGSWISQTGRSLATSEPAGPVTVHDLERGTSRTYRVPIDVIEIVAFSPKDDWLVVTGVNNDHPAYLTVVIPRDGVPRTIEADDRYLVQGTLVTPDGRSLVVGRCEENADLWLLEPTAGAAGAP